MIPAKESDSDYNSFLSHAAEVHMAVYGAAVGLYLGYSDQVRGEMKDQLHYLVGFALGSFVVSYVWFKMKEKSD